MQIAIIIIVILLLTRVNAFYASAEMSIVSVNTKKISKELATSKNGKLLKKLLDNTTNFLSTIQVAITLSGFVSASIAGSNLSVYVVNLFALVKITLNENIAGLIVTVILSYFSLIFGELYPKKLALKNPEKVALKSARIIYISMIISKPFVRLLSFSTGVLLKITGNDKQTEEEKVSEEEIRSLIITGHIEGAINESEREMIESVFNFNDLLVEAIMTPRTDVFAIDIKKPIYDYLDEIIREGFSRIPVYERDIDNIIGILHVKDLFKYAKEHGFDQLDANKLMRKPFFVPTHMKIDALFKKMQATKNQIAILIDEYGGFVGIVTIEDLVEEIVGNIYDEYDEIDLTIQTLQDNTYLVDGAIQIQELNKRLKLNIDETNDEYDTLGGLIISLLGFIPTIDYTENIIYDNLILKIHKVSSNRIDEVLITIPKKEEINEEQEEK